MRRLFAMSLTLRPATPDDLAELAALHAACFDDAERWSAAQLQGSLSLSTTVALLALAEGERAGFLLAQQAGGETEILTLCVNPALRQKGIGEALLRQVLSQGPVFLEVAADNAPARRLYERCGFKAFGLRPAYYVREGGRVDAVTYRRDDLRA